MAYPHLCRVHFPPVVQGHVELPVEFVFAEVGLEVDVAVVSQCVTKLLGEAEVLAAPQEVAA